MAKNPTLYKKTSPFIYREKPKGEAIGLGPRARKLVIGTGERQSWKGNIKKKQKKETNKYGKRKTKVTNRNYIFSLTYVSYMNLYT